MNGIASGNSGFFLVSVLDRIVNSPFGRILKGIREDEIAALAMGKNVDRYKIIVLAIGGFFAGIAGSLYAEAQILLADEPSVGLSPNYIELIFEKFVEINQNGISVLLVEQNARMALEVCDRAYVFEVGKIAIQQS
jgi:ABC-type arginine transport system ATPase subunit